MMKEKWKNREIENNLTHSVTHFHFHCSSIQIISIAHPPIPPKYLSLSLWMKTQIHTSLISIIQINNHPCPYMNSNHSPTPHSPFPNNTLNLPPSSPKTIISLVNPQNQSLPPFSLIHFIRFKNVIE